MTEDEVQRQGVQDGNLITHWKGRAEAAEKRLSALEHALHGVGFRVTYVTADRADNIAASLDALEAKP